MVSSNTPISMRRVISTWWPLAASGLLMTAEPPVISAVIARLANPEISLASYGGVVWPLSVLIEAPILMLLAASVALSKDLVSYKKIYRYMMVICAFLTTVHVLVAFTPLFDGVVRGLMHVPEEILVPTRIGLMIMTPWTWAIGYRRFNQGALIRFGYSKAVGFGTMLRLTTLCLGLAVGYWIGRLPGIVVACVAENAATVLEAIYIGLMIRPVIKNELRLAAPAAEPVTLHSFIAFYAPLAMTSVLLCLIRPVGSAAIGRMPGALVSLALWSVVNGFVSMLGSTGGAYNEVVVALLDQPGSSANLLRFTAWLGGLTTLFLFLVAVTPLSDIWFGQISALPAYLTGIARTGLWIGLPVPLLTAFASMFQGSILHGKRTRGITEAVGLSLTINMVVLFIGVAAHAFLGLYVGMAAMVLSAFIQTTWLWHRSRAVIRGVQARDRVPGAEVAFRRD
jgi:hypothetical protein